METLGEKSEETLCVGVLEGQAGGMLSHRWLTSVSGEPGQRLWEPANTGRAERNMGSASSSYRVIYLDVDGRIQKVRYIPVMLKHIIIIIIIIIIIT